MYTPPFNRVSDERAVREMVAACRAAWLVTVGPDGFPAATLLPVLWRDQIVIAHMAKANPQWREIADDAPALLIAGGAQAYISPSWYAAKAEHGKVVPTWNYAAVHLTGRVRVQHDIEWVRNAVTELTDHHEAHRSEPWHISDAPPIYVDAQLNGIVGIEFTVTGVEGKAKLSQNRSDADQAGVIDGLRAESLDTFDRAQAAEIADEMDEPRSPIR